MSGFTKLRTYEVDSVSYQIDVDASGEFSAIVDGARMKANSLKALTEKLKKHTRTSRKIAVPIHMLDDFGATDDKLIIRPVTITGIHAGNNNVIVKDDKTGVTEQLRYFGGHTVRRLTGPEIQEFVQLAKALKAAYNGIHDWVNAREVNPHSLVEEAAEATDPALDRNTKEPE